MTPHRLLFGLLAPACAALALGSPAAGSAAGGSPGGEAPAAKPAAWVPMRYDQPVVFTIAMDSDPATNGRITVALANRLARNGGRTSSLTPSAAPPSGLGPVQRAWVIPGGAMTLTDLQAQCTVPETKLVGAFIVLPTAVSNSVDNGIILSRANSEVFLNVIAARCDKQGDRPSANPLSIVWTSTTEHGANVRTQVEFFPLAVLTSVYLALTPQRTSQQTTTVAYPTTVPIPPGGERTSVQTLNSDVYNPSGTASLQGGVLNAFSGSGLGTTIGAAPSPDRQTFHAIDDAMGYIVKQINAACSGDSAQSWPFCSW